MSALPVIEPFVERAPSSRPAPRTLPRFPEPIIIELPRKRIQRGRVKQVQTKKRVSTAIGQVASFAFVTAVAFSTFSLAGQVMVEKARREGIRAEALAQETSREIADLRGQVQDLSSSKTIDDWAIANGFIPTESVPKATGVSQNVAKQP
jgi:cell division protein FtsL